MIWTSSPPHASHDQIFDADGPAAFADPDRVLFFREGVLYVQRLDVAGARMISTPGHEWCPMVTPDGKYLFFSRRSGAYDTQGWDGTTDGDVFWVDVPALDKHRSAAR